MSMLKKLIRGKGFTLVELLVVIAIIGVLVALVMPAISTALLRGRALAASSNGRSMHQMMISKETEGIYMTASSTWPKKAARKPESAEFPTSTDFFEHMVTNGTMNVSFSFFALPGVPSASTRDQFLTDDIGKYNAWCVTANAETIPETAPLFMTRNLKPFDKLSDDPVNGTIQRASLDGQPFLDKAFIFTTRGGASFSLIRDDLMQTTFTQLFIRADGRTGQNLTNDVLRPGGTY